MATIKKEFEVLNIKCGGCANSVQKALKKEYGDVLVNLDVTPRIITVNADDNFSEEAFKKKIKSLGYPSADEDLGTFEEVGAKAKSFVSCAIGKMDSKS